MWLANSIVADVDRVAGIYYVNRQDCIAWNKYRRDGELRLLTGWCWTAKSGTRYRQGFKTRTVCYRDAWYVLVQHAEAPPFSRPRLRIATDKGRAAA